ITYSMTSFLTTGGIRGGKRHVGKFHPRSFNMGMSKEVFQRTQGFSSMRYGEDVEFSIRTIGSGFKTGLIDEAFVYHKRRTSIVQFFNHVFHSGSARVEFFKLHRAELKLVHFFPAAFTIYSLATLFAALVDVKTHLLLASLLMIYFMWILIDATIRN